jgi:hypothetical protein
MNRLNDIKEIRRGIGLIFIGAGAYYGVFILYLEVRKMNTTDILVILIVTLVGLGILGIGIIGILEGRELLKLKKQKNAKL